MDEEDQAGRLPTAAALDDEPARTGGGWLREGARLLGFRPPDWQQLQAPPALVAWFILAGYLISLAVQRALLDGQPTLQWTGFLGGWAGTAVMAWLCWVVARSRPLPLRPLPAATLFALGCAAGLVFSLGMGAGLLLLRAVLGPADGWPDAVQWTVWLLPLSWSGLAQLALMWRVAGSRAARGAALLLVPLALALSGWLSPVNFWWPEQPPEGDAVAEVGLPLTDEVINAQSQLLATALAGLQAPQPGRVNVYAATFAPYASEDVFMRESAVVARTMRERFGADGRLVELVANRATSSTLPWGTPANLRQTVQRLAAVMDRDRDVLFLHLTSHGGADGKLANDTWPLQTEAMTPELLKRWLDEAGVRWRVISVSACYSGSWIAPLAGDGTLVMTAADADHTSYGCGKRSELTFFGRAMFDEALRKTWSFTEAHAAARKVIEVREQEAGKSDGFSNPQISEGAGIRRVLARLAGELSSQRAE